MPAQNAAQDAIQQLARLVSQQPDLNFPITSDKAQAWLINTYLDEVRRTQCFPLVKILLDEGHPCSEAFRSHTPFARNCWKVPCRCRCLR
jgi:hypothetical protein